MRLFFLAYPRKDYQTTIHAINSLKMHCHSAYKHGLTKVVFLNPSTCTFSDAVGGGRMTLALVC